MTDAEAEDVAAIENLLREDLNPMELAELYRRFVDRGMNSLDVAVMFQQPHWHVMWHLRLLELLPEYQDAARSGVLPLVQAAELARLPQAQQPIMFRRWAQGIDPAAFTRRITALLDLDRQTPLLAPDDPSGAALMNRLEQVLDAVARQVGSCFDRQTLDLMAWVSEGRVDLHLDQLGLIRRELGKIETALRRAQARREMKADREVA